MRVFKNEDEFQKIYKIIKAAADHHAQNVSKVIDILYQAIKQFRDQNTNVVLASNSVLITMKGNIYRFSYKDNQIHLGLDGQNSTIIASFDNNTTQNDVFNVFKNL